MMTYFVRFFLGGNTGTREMASLLFMIWLAWTGWIMRQESLEAEITTTYAMWNVYTPISFLWLAAAFGLNKVLDQTKLGNKPPEAG